MKASSLALSSAVMAGLCLPLAAQDVKPAIPSALQDLVPNDASTLIVISPLDDLEAAVQDLLMVAMPEMAAMADLDMLFQQLDQINGGPGMDLNLVDRTRPIGIALGQLDLIGGTEPEFYMMLPCTDIQAVLESVPASMPLQATRVHEGYLGVCQEVYPVVTGDSKLAATLPQGLIAATFDARPLVEAFGPMAGFMTAMGVGPARAALDADKNTPPALRELANGILDDAPTTVTDVLDSLKALQLSVNMSGTVLDVNSALLLQDGSLLSSLAESEGASFAELAHLIDQNAPVSFGYGADLGGMARWIRPYVDQILGGVVIPDDIEAEGDAGPFSSPRHALAVVREASDKGLAALSNFGSGMVSSMNVVDGKPSSTFWMHGVDGGTLASNLSLFFRTELAGVVGLEMTSTKLGQATTECAVTLNADTLAANFDMTADEALQIKSVFAEAFGDSIKLSLTSVGSDTLVLYNGTRDDLKNALLAATKAKRGTTQDIVRLNGALTGASPFEFMRVDLGAMARTAIPIFEKFEGPSGIPEEMLDGISVPMTTHSGMTAKKWMGGMSIDLRDLGKLAMMVMTFAPSK